VKIKFKIIFFVLLFVSFGLSLRAQSRSKTQTQTRKTGGERSRTTDSLRQVLRTYGQDTNRVNGLNNLASEIGSDNPDTAITIANEALSLSRKLKWKKGEAWVELGLGIFNRNKTDIKEAIVHYNNALNICETLIASQNPADAITGKKVKGKTLANMGSVYHDQADFARALDYYFKGLKMMEEVGDKKSVRITFGNIAGVYSEQSDFPKAQEYNFKALKIVEESGDKRGLGNTLVNIAIGYKVQGEWPKALDYYFKGLKIAEELKDKELIGRTLGNIANVYSNQSDYPNALRYHFRSLKIKEELGNKNWAGRTLGNIAVVYVYQADSAVAKGNMAFARTEKYPKALEYYFKGLKILQEVGDKGGAGVILSSIGSLYTTLNKYKEAERYLASALLISKEIGAKDLEKSVCKMLSIHYEKTNRPALALEHYKKFIALRDTIFSQENSKKLMRSEMDHEYEKKKAVTDAEHNMEIQNQKLITDEKNKKQNIIIGSVIAGLILVMIFAGFVFRSLRTTRKQKAIIELKNIETENQKKEIEEHQKEILDSIHYAKRIQMAQIPSEKRVGNILLRLRKL